MKRVKPIIEKVPTPSRIAWEGLLGLLLAIAPLLMLRGNLFNSICEVFGQFAVATIAGFITALGILLADRGRLTRQGRADIKGIATFREADSWNVVLGFLASFIGVYDGLLGIIPAILVFYKNDILYFMKNWRW